MMLAPGGRRPMADINVTPFVDVVLVLLIIFMVTAPFLQGGLEIDLPKVSTSGLDVHEGLIVSIRGDLTLAQATEIGQRDTRRYAKRQFTWIANQMPDWPRVASSRLDDRIAALLN